MLLLYIPASYLRVTWSPYMVAESMTEMAQMACHAMKQVASKCLTSKQCFQVAFEGVCQAHLPAHARYQDTLGDVPLQQLHKGVAVLALLAPPLLALLLFLLRRLLFQVSE